MLYLEDGILYLTKGDDGALEVGAILDARGVAYDMQDGDFLTLTVRETPTLDSPVVFQTTGLPGSNRLIVRSEDTAHAEPGRYSADIQLTTADGLRFTIWPSIEGSARYKTSNLKNFIIMPEVTNP